MRSGMALVVMILIWSPFVYGVDNEAPEYTDQNGNAVQFVDGYTGQTISREEFVVQQQRIESQFMSGADRILGETQKYMTTAKEGEDKEITQGVIDGIQQSKRNVSNQHSEVIKQAQTYQPRQAYGKPRVLVSGGNSSSV